MLNLNEGKRKLKKIHKALDIISDIFLIILIIAGIYYSFIYNHSSKKVLSEQDENNYPVYKYSSGYEYYRSLLQPEHRKIYDELKEAIFLFHEDFSIHTKDISSSEFNDIYSYVQLDHPEIFWTSSDNSYMTTVVFYNHEKILTNKKVKLFYDYTVSQAKTVKDEMEKVYEPIITNARKLNSEYEQIKYIHNTLIDIGTYTKYDTSQTKEYQSIISIFQTGNTVCSGFSYGFKFLCDKLYIPSITIKDISNEDETKNHAWNMVYVKDMWLNLDITYDNEISDNCDSIAYNYFLKPNDIFYSDHKLPDNLPN